MKHSPLPCLAIPHPLILACPVVLAAGCVSGSLATDTGPHPRGCVWSDASTQKMHVGEEVRFDFVLQDSTTRKFVSPMGRADYCVATIGDRRLEAEVTSTGHFQFSHTFGDIKPGDKIKVQATAYRQRAGRDFVNVHGQWLRTESPYEQPDAKVARDSVSLVAYQAPIELRIPRPPDDLNPETGVLRIRRSDGSSTSVYIDRPHRPGFTVGGPEPDGHYRIGYVPRDNEVNPIGTTDVELVMYDTAGNPHYASATLDTP